EQLVDKGRLAVIDVRDDGDVPKAHGERSLAGNRERARPLDFSLRGNKDFAEKLSTKWRSRSAARHSLSGMNMAMIRTIASLLAFAAAALALPAQAALPPAAAWEIGPVIKGRNYSHNMPLRPAPARDGVRIDFPWPDARAGHVHYVTCRHGPLEGKRRIVMRFRIDAEPGVRFVPQEFPERQAEIGRASCRERVEMSEVAACGQNEE